MPMGNLYIVATPIGNLQDTTFRAGKLILSASVLVTESTSKANILIKFLEDELNVKAAEKKIISLNQDEEINKIPMVIKTLETDDIVLISEAGTPLISDPGYKLVREAIKRGVTVIPIPGATAAMAALVSSGLPSDSFYFLGFLPKQQSKIIKKLSELKKIDKTTAILYESPSRCIETISSIKEVFGNVDMVVARELTKIHEEIIRGTADAVLISLSRKTIKGEVTILFSTT